MRNAFGLPQALMIILFISGIVTVTMKYTSIGAKHYADSYTREQAELFLQSATEAALFQISGHDRNATGYCLRNFTIKSFDERFTAEIKIRQYYLFKDEPICKDIDGNLISTAIDTEESNGMIDMNVIVTSVDPKTHTDKKVGNQVRLVRRSLQRP